MFPLPFTRHFYWDTHLKGVLSQSNSSCLLLSGSPGEGNQLLPHLHYTKILGSVQKAVKFCKM